MTIPALFLAAALASGEHYIPNSQGTHVDPKGNTIEVTSKCFRMNGEPTVGVMGEMHYARVPEAEWRDYVVKMREGGLNYIATYVFWIHHEEKEGVFDFSGNRDINKFLKICEEEKMSVVLRIGPWDHGECIYGGFPEWLLDKKIQVRTPRGPFMGYVECFWRELFKQVDGHLYKQGGCVVGCQLENECSGPWSYFTALKKTAIEVGFDVPFYTRTGWPAMSGRERVAYGEILPLFGDYADGFWDRKFQMSPGNYKNAFKFSNTRSSANIATEQIPADLLGKDDKTTTQYPYLTCELGGGMPSAYHRRLQVFPKDAFAMAIVKLGSGSNLLGYYMYAGGTNPNRPQEGVFFNESQANYKSTNHNDLPPFSYEFDGPISEFGERAPHYAQLKRIHDFCRTRGKEFALEDSVFVAPNETKRGKFVFHNDYVRGINDSNEIWISEEVDGKVVKLVEWKADDVNKAYETVEAEHATSREIAFKLTKSAGALRTIVKGQRGVAAQPTEADWAEAAVYELDIPPSLNTQHASLITISWTGDVIRLYADGVPVADQFYAGKPFKAGLWRYPAKKYEIKILPWPETDLIYVQTGAPEKGAVEVKCAQLLSLQRWN